MKYPFDGVYSSMRGHGEPLDTPEARHKLALRDNVVLDLGPGSQNPQILQSLREANPNIRLHAYVVLKAYNWPGAFFQEMLKAVQDTDGFIYIERSTRTWDFTNINLARPATVEAIASIINRYAALMWDALFIDILIPELLSAAQDNGMSPLDWKRMGFKTENDFLLQWKIGAAMLISKLNKRPISTNYEIGTAETNGHVEEGFYRLSGTWEKAMKKLWGAPHADPVASWLCAQPAMDSTGDYNPDNPENQRISRFVGGSSCLGNAYGGFGRYENDSLWLKRRLDFIFPWMSVTPRGHADLKMEHKGWLGENIGPYVKLPEGLYWRDFEHGQVIVNPTYLPISYRGPERLRAISGIWKKQWSVPPQDALFLVRT